MNIPQRLRALMGDAAVRDGPDGVPLTIPPTDAACAAALGLAAAASWRVRLEGNGRWLPSDAPADVALRTSALTGVEYLNAPDLVATVRAGMSWGALRRVLADHGAWVTIDPPGEDERSVGSVVATGTAGALATGFGEVRDHVLGVTLVTANGRIVRAGGRVVKNVAGFDLTRLAPGSFGAFGAITAVTLRLRTLPRADLTLVGAGPRDTLLDAARVMLSAGVTPAALELASGTDLEEGDWTMAVRIVGSDGEAAATRDAARGAVPIALEEASASDAAQHWESHRRVATHGAVTIRLGYLPAALEAALDLLGHFLPKGRATATPARGTLRWSGSAGPDDLKRLRHAAAQVEMPMTLERAPWALREAVGHYGAYRSGVARLVRGVRSAFDRQRTLSVALGDDG